MTGLRIAASNIGWGADDDARVLSRMAELGFSGLEVAPTRIFPEDPYAKRDGFARYAQEVSDNYGLRICSMQSIWRGRDESIFSESGGAALIAYTASACDFAHAGGAGNLVFGCPRNRAMPPDAAPHDAVPFLLECGRLAASVDAVFAIEANPAIYGTNFLNTTEETIDLLVSIGLVDGLGINLDVGAMVYGQEGIEVAEAALPYLSHVHISEPHLARLERRFLHRQLREVLEDVGYDGYVSLEMGTADPDVVEEGLIYMAEVFLG